MVMGLYKCGRNGLACALLYLHKLQVSCDGESPHVKRKLQVFDQATNSKRGKAGEEEALFYSSHPENFPRNHTREYIIQIISTMPGG